MTDTELAQPGRTSLRGQIVVIVGGSSGIGLDTARLAKSEGAELILTGGNGDRLRRAAEELEPQHTAIVDLGDSDAAEASSKRCRCRSITSW